MARTRVEPLEGGALVSAVDAAPAVPVPERRALDRVGSTLRFVTGNDATQAKAQGPRARGEAVEGAVSALETLAGRWRSAARVVALTGAGLSTASGIPDFRSPGGRWERYQPVPLPDFLASESARRKYWRYKGETWQVIRSALPNPAHRALADLARADRVHLLVTQNVDGLHERSGFPPARLVNIHGTDSEVECMTCHRRAARAAAQEAWESGTEVPLCPCGGPWKPATISFGQNLVAGDLERATRAAAASDLFIAAGTSLVVGPINQMFSIAAGSGAFTAILTASDTPFDAQSDCKLSAPVEQVLAELRDLVLG